MVVKCEWCSLGTLKINETSSKVFNMWVIIHESSKSQLCRSPFWSSLRCIRSDAFELKVFFVALKPIFDPFLICRYTLAAHRMPRRWIKNKFSRKNHVRIQTSFINSSGSKQESLVLNGSPDPSHFIFEINVGKRRFCGGICWQS